MKGRQQDYSEGNLNQVRVQIEVAIASLSRWLARKEIKVGDYLKNSDDPVHLENAVNAYLRQHGGRLRSEAKSILRV